MPTNCHQKGLKTADYPGLVRKMLRGIIREN